MTKDGNDGANETNNTLDLNDLRFFKEDVFGLQDFTSNIAASFKPFNEVAETFAGINKDIFQVTRTNAAVMDSIREISKRLDISPKVSFAQSIQSEALIRLRESLDPMVGLQETVSAVKQSLNAIPAANITAMQAALEDLNGAASFSVANSIQEATARFHYTESPVIKHREVEEIPVEEVHDMLIKDAEIGKEETGKDVPYNVLSNHFIYTYYLPVMGIIHNASTAETVDTNFVMSTLIFTLVPLLYSLSQDKCTEKDNTVDFDNKVSFLDDGDRN